MNDTNRYAVIEVIGKTTIWIGKTDYINRPEIKTVAKHVPVNLANVRYRMTMTEAESLMKPGREIVYCGIEE